MFRTTADSQIDKANKLVTTEWEFETYIRIVSQEEIRELKSLAIRKPHKVRYFFSSLDLAQHTQHLLNLKECPPTVQDNNLDPILLEKGDTLYWVHYQGSLIRQNVLPINAYFRIMAFDILDAYEFEFEFTSL
jgi:hypothetical protein